MRFYLLVLKGDVVPVVSQVSPLIFPTCSEPEDKSMMNSGESGYLVNDDFEFLCC